MYVFISDFDGTITEDDFFTLISARYFTDEMLAPWREYLSGRQTHFNALNEMFKQIHIPEAELKTFIRQIHFDKAFFKVCTLCNRKNIPIYICSAGCDYYIEELIGRELKEYGITLITNRSEYNPKQGLRMHKPRLGSLYYSETTGISKKAIVEHLHEKGYKVIFAGDGPPDFEPAQIADVVFARKLLLEKCRQAGLKTQPFGSFKNVYDYIKSNC